MIRNGEANRREGLWEPGISEDERRVRRGEARQSVEELKMEMDSSWPRCRFSSETLEQGNGQSTLYPTLNSRMQPQSRLIATKPSKAPTHQRN